MTAAPTVLAGQSWRGDGLGGLDRGSRVWWRASETEWQPATIVSNSAKECSIALDTPAGQGTGKPLKTTPGLLVPANPPILDGVNDLTSLSYLNEPAILHDLRQRYSVDQIYTHAGPVLIAVNPFKGVPTLYTDAVLRHYKARRSGEHQEGFEPHIFLTADKAYKDMCRDGRSQSLIVNGESGAGKTETTKIAMRYLAGLAGGTGVETRVLETNPLLEAFGNAKTLRNNNSSRFGKLIQIYFNNSRVICGALIQTYLLEKSRVTHQLPGERNYHIFYQLLRGASASERKRWCLPEQVEAFKYLSESGCSEIAGTDDAADFGEVRLSLSHLGISDEQQDEMFTLLSAILWLGNVRLKPIKRGTGDDTVEVLAGPALSTAARLLGVPEPALIKALSKRNISAGGESIDVEMKLEAALDTRDALAKSIYAAIFKWLVEKINDALAVGNKRTSDISLSILDIYGFECFKENSFEQLCINYANERLQQQFNRHLFKLEQEVYASEGIDWRHVEFVDNQACVDLIESRPPKGVGVLSLLDEECIYPKARLLSHVCTATDMTFAAKLRANLAGKNKHFDYDKKSVTGDFIIDHYAGDVQYTCTKFLDKNRDSLSMDLVKMMTASKQPLLNMLAVDIAKSQEKRGSQTVGFRFREQLQDLISRLDETELHFVRCIKPNDGQRPSDFDAPLTLHQLRCCGVLEVTRIARAGYPTRYLHRQFAERYHALLHGGQSEMASGNALEVCKQLLVEFRIPADMYQIGRTKLFFRAGVLGHLEDTSARLNRAVLYMQSRFRMVRCRRVFLRHRRAAVAIQAAARGAAARRRYGQMVREHHAAIVIQSRQRGRAARSEYRRSREAVVAIQMAQRRWKVQKRVQTRLAARRRREAEEARVAAGIAAEEQRFEAIKQRFGLDAAGIIDALTLWQEHGHDIVARRQGHEAANGDAKVDGQTNGYHSQLTTSASTPEVTEDAMEQIALWEEYSCKLEAQVHALTSENDALQRRIASVQSSLANGASAGNASGEPSTTPQSDIGFSEDWPGDEGDTSQRQSVASGAKYVEKLNEEFSKRAPMFQDDALFIKEVKEGTSQTLYPMDPERELENLRRNWATFKRDFKARLEETARILKKVEAEQRRASGSGTEAKPFGDKQPAVSMRTPAVISSSPQRPASAEPEGDGAARRGKRSLISRGFSSFTRKTPGGAPASPQAARVPPQTP